MWGSFIVVWKSTYTQEAAYGNRVSKVVDCPNYLCDNGAESHNYFSFQLTQCSAWSVVGAGKILQKEGVSLFGSGVSSHQDPAAFEVSLGFMAAARGAS